MAALALAACLLFLAGCGFRPLYAKPDASSSVTADLAHIKVLTIENRIGQKLRNHLVEDLDPNGSAEAPLYTLGVGLTISKQELGLRITEEATRAKLTVAANFALNDIRTGEVLYSGTTRAVNSYNITDSAYATLSAEEDALDRAARVISEEIKLRLGLYFDRPSS